LIGWIEGRHRTAAARVCPGESGRWLLGDEIDPYYVAPSHRSIEAA
jgi:hypothetical protein